MNRIRAIAVLLLCVCVLAGPGAAAEKGEPVAVDTVTDYARTSSWLSVDRSASLPVDVFYLYPTAWQRGAGDGSFCPADHPSMLRGAQGLSTGRRRRFFLWAISTRRITGRQTLPMY